jgi:putative ABC transport system substrate-binding protein
MGRREFITGLGAAVAWPLVARAQQPALPVIGYLGDISFELRRERVAAFIQGLGETGFVDGRNVTIEYHWAEGQYERMPAMATELVRRQVHVIAAMGGLPAAQAAKAATTTIPVVFNVGVDPVETRLVASLARPGGNLTGSSLLNSQVIAKRFELLHELIPAATSIALLANPANKLNIEAETREAQKAARVLGVELLVLNASSDGDIQPAFEKAVQQSAGAVVVSSDPVLFARRDLIVALAARHSMPAIFHDRGYSMAGGLMSYGMNQAEGFRLAGAYTGRILKGERPADLPVQQGVRVELVINLKSAKALRLTVPQSILLRADEVIE